jgi:hypothetical protein
LRRGAQAPTYGPLQAISHPFDKLRIGAAKIGMRRESLRQRYRKFVKPVLDLIRTELRNLLPIAIKTD